MRLLRMKRTCNRIFCMTETEFRDQGTLRGDSEPQAMVLCQPMGLKAMQVEFLDPFVKPPLCSRV
jgi:hypothetical protein